MESTETSIFEEEEVVLVAASSGKRLANYLLDAVGFYGFTFLLGGAMALISASSLDYLEYLEEHPAEQRIIALIIYGIYMGLLEMMLKGRSFGKLITRTAVVTANGEPVSAGKLFLRGICRAVPFEVFSGLGTPCAPWHDKWTNTLVIDLKQSTLKSDTNI
jgi:uncharacterized RDD family membrane protein YckC